MQQRRNGIYRLDQSTCNQDAHPVRTGHPDLSSDTVAECKGKQNCNLESGAAARGYPPGPHRRTLLSQFTSDGSFKNCFFLSKLSVVRLTSVFSGGKSCPKMIARRSLFSRRKIARLVRSFPSSCSVVTFSRGRSGVRGRSVRMSYTVSIIEVAIT
jgi:hypothetical protein